MRRAAKADENQPLIVSTLRSVGAKVEHTHTVGGGFPDLVVWAKGRTFLAEVKMPGETLNKQQAEFFAAWPGEIYILRTREDAFRAVMGEEALR